MTVGAERVPLADPRPLLSLLRRGRILRVVLALGLVIAALLAIAAANRLRAQPAPVALPNTSSILVVDISSSITSDVFRQIEHTIHSAARSGDRYGLVVFSDVAYEALPPGTPARELARVARYFDAREAQPSDPSPWTATFSGGTRISTGLALAAEVARRDRLTRPAVLLVSDLDDDPNDVPALRRELEELERRGVAVSVVGLNPAPEDERFFARLLAEPESLRHATVDERAEPTARARFPVAFVALAALLAVSLAAHELWRARLRWAS
jgi:hypothetical protein